MKSLEYVKQHIDYLLSWKTKRKLLIIESDDWGSERMPSKIVYDKLKSSGLNMSNCYNQFDSLETKDDLEPLFNLLAEIKNEEGKHPIFTANFILANPDYDAIKIHKFENYYNIPIANNRSYGESLSIIKEGIKNRLMLPQFHGREHLNFTKWLKALKEKHFQTYLAFENNFFALDTDNTFSKSGHYLAAYDYDSLENLNTIKDVISDGLSIFNKTFGFKSESFIAPNYVWSNNLEQHLRDCGIKYIQSQRNQIIPQQKNYGTLFHYTGQRNKLNQYFLVRNVHFEPSSNDQINFTLKAFKQIERAFLWNTPAIISTHRVNFVGSVVRKNREDNLNALKQLLTKVVKTWPNVEFITTTELGDIISKNIK